MHLSPTVRAQTDTARLPPVLVVGLTGGIGSGKSTVSAMLADHGAVIIDADAITRKLQEPGTEVFVDMVERFGQQIVASDGSLDRQAVADVVFADPEALADLNAMVHPAVGSEIANRLAAAADAPVPDGATAPIVVLDVPLLVETGRTDVAAVIVVDTDPDLQMQRLVQQRGLDAADASARMSRQATRQQRLDRADQVIDNTSDLDHLRSETDRVWAWLCDLQASPSSEAPE